MPAEHRRSRRGFGALAALTAVTVAAGTPLAAAGPSARPGTRERVSVPSSMGPITVDVQWARHGGRGALYLLDGLRARSDESGWSLHTDAFAEFGQDDVTVVAPAGGESSFYADWATSSIWNGQGRPYRWETFLTRELPDYLAGFGVARDRVAVAGLSMGASAALSLAAFHRDQFVHASAFSGALAWTLPGIREALRAAAWQGGGYDLGALAPAGSAQWARMDPVEFAPRLAGLPMYISAATGVPGPEDASAGPGSTMAAIAIEAAAAMSTRAFEDRLRSLGIAAVTAYPAVGTHSWPYWGAQLAAARPYILDAVREH